MKKRILVYARKLHTWQMWLASQHVSISTDCLISETRMSWTFLLQLVFGIIYLRLQVKSIPVLWTLIFMVKWSLPNGSGMISQLSFCNTRIVGVFKARSRPDHDTFLEHRYVGKPSFRITEVRSPQSFRPWQSSHIFVNRCPKNGGERCNHQKGGGNWLTRLVRSSWDSTAGDGGA